MLQYVMNSISLYIARNNIFNPSLITKFTHKHNYLILGNAENNVLTHNVHGVRSGFMAGLILPRPLPST